MDGTDWEAAGGIVHIQNRFGNGKSLTNWKVRD